MCLPERETRRYWDLTPGACKPCTLPSIRMEAETWSQDRDINGLMGGEPTCLKQCPGATLPCVRQCDEAGHGSCLASSGRDGVTSYRGN